MTAVAANLDFFGPRLFTELAAILLVGLASTGNVGTFFHIGHTVSSKARDRSARSISCRKSNLGRLGKILYARAETLGALPSHRENARFNGVSWRLAALA